MCLRKKEKQQQQSTHKENRQKKAEAQGGKKKTKQNLKEARHRCPFDIVTCLVNDRFSVSVSSQFQKKKKKLQA